MSQITLVAGLASTVSLPATHLLARLLGWRGALLTLAGCALLALAPLLLLPDDRDVRSDFSHSPGRFQRGPRSADSRTVLCALTVFLSNALAVGLVTHLLRILTSLGWPTPSAVRIAALAGVAQCAARLCDVISGGAAGPFRLNRLAGALMSAGLGMALVFSQSLAAVIGFVALLGASGGITTIVRGALPILLFPGEQGAASVAWITASACLATAVAPPLYGLLVDRGGPAGVLVVSLALALVSLAFSLVLEAIHADHANRTSPSASARTGSPSRGL